MTINYRWKSLILYVKIILCLTFENRFMTREALFIFITPLERRKGGGVEIVWFGVSKRELKLKTTLQRRLIVNG